MFKDFSDLLISIGAIKPDSQWLAVIIALIILGTLSFTLFVVAKSYVMPKVRTFIGYIKPEFAIDMEKPLLKLTNRLAWLFPCLFCLVTLNWFIPETLTSKLSIYKILYIYLYFIVALIFTSLLSIIGIVYHRQSYTKHVPLKGVIQIVKLAVAIVFTVLTVAELMDKTPLYLLSSLGALTAILLLIFKDTILGLVAGVQIATHRLVAHGDWIEMPKFGADGEVLEVGLHTVKVKNWDNTITSIPTTSLMNDSFKNWRGMSESAGRRIKRAIHIDINDIVIIDEQQKDNMIAALDGSFALFCQQREVAQTNIGLYRDYCEFYLLHHPLINKELTLMARQLQPTEYGIAVELYCFCIDKSWVPYEKAQAQIVEHLLAVLQVFELHAFQRPRGEQHSL